MRSHTLHQTNTVANTDGLNPTSAYQGRALNSVHEVDVVVSVPDFIRDGWAHCQPFTKAIIGLWQRGGQKKSSPNGAKKIALKQAAIQRLTGNTFTYHPI